MPTEDRTPTAKIGHDLTTKHYAKPVLNMIFREMSIVTNHDIYSGFMVCVTHKLFAIIESSVNINSIFLNCRCCHIVNE